MNANTLVYFIRPIGLVGPVKIGVSASPEERLGQLMTWSPYPLEIAVAIPGGQDLERNIHECLSEHHSHREWFHPTPKVLGVVEKLMAGIPIEQALNLNDRRGKIIRDRKPVSAERRQYLSLSARVRCALDKQCRKQGKRVFWDLAEDELVRRFEKWDGNGPCPSDLLWAIEELLRNPEQHISHIAPWDRKKAPQPTQPQQGSATA